MSHATARRIRRQAIRHDSRKAPKKLMPRSWYTKKHTSARTS